MLKRLFYTLAILTLVVGLAYTFFVFEPPICGDEEPCEPTRASAALGVVTFGLIFGYVGRAVGNKR